MDNQARSEPDGRSSTAGARPADGPQGQVTIGAALGTAKAEILRLAGRLRPFLDAGDVDRLDGILADLENQHCRVAVLGQVKAGKSSLVNLLIRRPGLSPVDVNPWTAVVSNLHFGVPAEPGARAVFTFFDEADWSYLASGGRLRELSDRVGMAIDENLLRLQLRQTRDRAEQRLGRQFFHLLGKQHRFAKATAELLARYVSIGHVDEDEDDSTNSPSPGRFSDITKAADLYFEQAPFGFPITIVDTPGTNDPFLVRDDLTGRALDGADVHIVVLTAEQAFSIADLSLLRLLHGLHKQRLVVFVNRIDSLADVAADSRRVVEHVRRRLAAEFPNADIPVVAGSARWAELAAPGSAGASAGLPPALVSFARMRGLMPEDADQPGTDGAGGDGIDWREAVAAAAGLRTLEATVARLVQQGPAMLALRRALGGLEAMLASTESRLRNDEAALGEVIELADRESAPAEQRLLGLALQLGQIAAVESELDRELDTLEQELALFNNLTVVRLRFALETVVQQFADAQGAALREEAERQRMASVWRCDTRPARRELERVFLGIYRHAAQELVSLERAAQERLRTLLPTLLPNPSIDVALPPPPVVDLEPSIGSLGQALALDLNEQWERWWHLWRTTGRRVRKVRALMHGEFQPMVAALLAVATSGLKAQCAAGLERFDGVRSDLLETLGRRRQRLGAVREVLGDQGDAASQAALIAAHEDRRAQQAEHRLQCRAIARELETLARWCGELAAPRAHGAAEEAGAA